ncbi:MAG: hypothetical protein Ct9H90mP3_4250 [Flammeovirgaceae bacterium]|nr:MAG: hypothetical protein Ct9H90mP3_4250 [Flammeovirgaceae bacterium]
MEMSFFFGQKKRFLMKILSIIGIIDQSSHFFFTATCEFGKFDDPLITSGGELLLNKGNGGAIALLTTTRPVFSQTNFRLNNQFYKNVFKKNDDEYRRLAIFLLIQKTIPFKWSYKQKFCTIR